jgi:hypothetical protein
VDNLGENAMIVLLPTLSVVLPILLAVWFVRTLTAIARAQQEIVAHLAGIETSLREAIKQPVI